MIKRSRFGLIVTQTICWSVMLVLFSCDQVQRILPSGTPDTIKIGMIERLDHNMDTVYGAQLAVHEINLEGGILGMPIELIVKDESGHREDAPRLAEELIAQDEVVAIVGPGASSDARLVAEVAQKHRIPMVTTTATALEVTDAGDFIFMAAFTDEFEGRLMAEFAFHELRAQTAATLTQSDELDSVELDEFFEEEFTKLGGTIVASETYKTGDTDFSAQLQVIADAEPDVFYIPGFVPEVPLVIVQSQTVRQRFSTGITATFLGSDRWDSPEFFDIAADAAEGSFFSDFFSAEHTGEFARGFVQNYIARFGVKPDGAAAMGYDAVRLVVTAMIRANSLQGKVIRDQLAKTREYVGATTILHFDESRHPVKSAVIIQVRDGGFHFHKQIEP